MFTDEEYESTIAATPAALFLLLLWFFMHRKAAERIWTLALNKKVVRVVMHKKKPVTLLHLIEHRNSSTGLFPPGSASSPFRFASAGDNVMHRRVCKPRPHWSAIDQDACLASRKLHHGAVINVAHVKMEVVYNFHHLVQLKFHVLPLLGWRSPKRTARDTGCVATQNINARQLRFSRRTDGQTCQVNVTHCAVGIQGVSLSPDSRWRRYNYTVSKQKENSVVVS